MTQKCKNCKKLISSLVILVDRAEAGLGESKWLGKQVSFMKASANRLNTLSSGINGNRRQVADDLFQAVTSIQRFTSCIRDATSETASLNSDAMELGRQVMDCIRRIRFPQK